MKTRTLSVLAGVGAPLILTGSSDAGFVGIKVTGRCTGAEDDPAVQISEEVLLKIQTAAMPALPPGSTG